MLVHKLYGPSFSGELSVGIGISPLPLFFNSIASLKCTWGHCCLGALVEREILYTAAASFISRACRDAACSSPTEQTFMWPQSREPPWQVGLQGMIGTKGRNKSV